MHRGILFRHEFSLSKLETVGLLTLLFGLSSMFISGRIPRPLQLLACNCLGNKAI